MSKYPRITNRRNALMTVTGVVLVAASVWGMHVEAASEHTREVREDRWSQVIEIRQTQLDALKERLGLTDDGHDTHEGGDEHEGGDDGGHMGHDFYEYVGDHVPTLDIVLHEDAKKGYNLELVTTNYTFAPAAVNTEPVAGEGHAHLYIDGEKITRLYGAWYYLGSLEPGMHEVMVELSANNHSPYAYAGEKIEMMKHIMVE